MAVVETEEHGQILVVRMNRPERLNALNHEMRSALAETWTQFRRSDRLDVGEFALAVEHGERRNIAREQIIYP